MSTRDDIAAVLDGLSIDVGGTVFPLSATAALPSTIQPFTSWPVWQATTWLTSAITEEEWRVFVTLPASSSDAWSDSGDVVVEPVRDQLLKIGAVVRVEPIALAVGDATQTIPALVFTLNV